MTSILIESLNCTYKKNNESPLSQRNKGYVRISTGYKEYCSCIGLSQTTTQKMLELCNYWQQSLQSWPWGCHCKYNVFFINITTNRTADPCRLAGSLDLSCSLSARESDFDPHLSMLLVVVIAVLDLESVDQAPQGVDLGYGPGYLRDHPAT